MNGEFKYMKEALATDLAELLVDEHDMNITEALNVLYDSETYLKLSRPETGLYFQSTPYVYSFLENELATGKMG